MSQREACQLLVDLCHVSFGSITLLVTDGHAHDVIASPTYREHELDQAGQAPDYDDPRLMQAAQVVAEHQHIRGGYATINVHTARATGLQPYHCKNWPGHMPTR